MNLLQVMFFVIFSLIVSVCYAERTELQKADIIFNEIESISWNKIHYFYEGDSKTRDYYGFTGYNRPVGTLTVKFVHHGQQIDIDLSVKAHGCIIYKQDFHGIIALYVFNFLNKNYYEDKEFLPKTYPEKTLCK